MFFLAFFLLFSDPTAGLEQQLKKVIDVFTVVSRQAADPVNSEHAFYDGAIPGMLRRLDPHSVFFDPTQFQQLQEMQKSERKGFGSVVSVLPGRVIVLQTLPGTPSEKAGLLPGDEILAVNGIPLSRLEFEQLVQLLSESHQRDAQLIVRRPGNARLLTFVLTPELMDSPSVDRVWKLTSTSGYIHVTSFDAQTARDLKQAIERLGGDRLKGLVLDLRDNPGGAVEAAVATASLFLKPGQRILSVRGRATKGQEADVPPSAKPYTFPVAVLVNGKTASASEIVTGALQDHDRAVVIGEPTYGKGLVQSVYPLSSNAGLALTTAFYYTPSGRSIQKPLAAGMLDAAAIAPPGDYRTDSGRKVAGGGGIQPDFVVHPDPVTRLRAVLDSSGSFVSFGASYARDHKIAPDFEVTPALLDQFQLYLSEHSIQPPVSEWLSERAWIESRLKQEIFNLAFGVAKGDEVEAQRDPMVKQALKSLASK
ncbi:MAG TPA: S41 family peptidase [Bryobacteraceae bacterium]|nr:S41 family peptidase [Bryobacteraceae bacterium]